MQQVYCGEESGCELAAVFAEVVIVSVVEATQRDLDVLAERAPELATSALAAVAIAMAEGIDSNNSLTSKSMAAKVLADTMAQLVVLAPAVEEGDDLDELAARRYARLAGESAAARPAGS